MDLASFFYINRLFFPRKTKKYTEKSICYDFKQIGYKIDSAIVIRKCMIIGSDVAI